MCVLKKSRKPRSPRSVRPYSRSSWPLLVAMWWVTGSVRRKAFFSLSYVPCRSQTMNSPSELLYVQWVNACGSADDMSPPAVAAPARRKTGGAGPCCAGRGYFSLLAGLGAIQEDEEGLISPESSPSLSSSSSWIAPRPAKSDCWVVCVCDCVRCDSDDCWLLVCVCVDVTERS